MNIFKEHTGATGLEQLATGRVRAEGTIMSIGKRVAFAEGRILDESGQLYSSATSTLLVFE
jgi:acyl-coenzyme A thioesterase PaaI-like protein